GTITKLLSQETGLPYLDTGLLYRELGRLIMKHNVSPDDSITLSNLAKEIRPENLTNTLLRNAEHGANASKIAIHKNVRVALLDYQRTFAKQPGGAILDGRDIGSVICPEADLKLFITADVEVRAKPRYDELIRREINITYEHVLAKLQERDNRDQSRHLAPLKPCEDAIVINTSVKTISEVMNEVINIYKTKATLFTQLSK
ncbi:MAG: (d)CMP kinase, partial [Pseudomonadota bacterium]